MGIRKWRALTAKGISKLSDYIRRHMLNIKSPTNYNEMLGKLNKSTFFTTLIFMVVLRVFDYLPLIKVPPSLIPPIKDNKEFIDWALSFGILPLCMAGVAFFLSHSFEIHNKLAKLFQIRYIWDKYFIVKPLAEIAKSDIEINREIVKKVMHELYYPQVKGIDQHYVTLFWRYAQTFWVIFEHFFVVLVFLLVSKLLFPSNSLKYIFIYAAFIAFLGLIQFVFVTAPKSKVQANQIPIGIVSKYFMNDVKQ